MDSQTIYEDEQERLRKRLGFADPEDEEDDGTSFEFSVPEVNPEIYRDVEPVLFQGFLTQAAKINGARFVFKSLNHHEFFKLGMFYDTSDPKEAKAYYTTFLAYGVVYVDGLNVLENRSEHLDDLQEFFDDLDAESKKKVIRHLSEVNRRANKAITLTEAYCIEASSRMRWAQYDGMDITSPSITGFSGTERLGLNWGQLLWRAINRLEDQRENAEREWENAKFVASSMAGKGMQKVYSADKRRRQTEMDEKVKRRDLVIRHALFNTPLDGDKADSGPIQVARTVAELASQLERDLKGEQDWHDKVIAEHEARLKRQYDARVEHVSKLREDHVQKYGDRAVIMLPAEQGLTAKDVEERIRKRQERHAEVLATRPKYPELFDPKFAELANKWMNQEPIVQPTPSVVPSLNPNRAKSAPFKGGR